MGCCLLRTINDKLSQSWASERLRELILFTGQFNTEYYSAFTDVIYSIGGSIS